MSHIDHYITIKKNIKIIIGIVLFKINSIHYNWSNLYYNVGMGFSTSASNVVTFSCIDKRKLPPITPG